MPMKDRRQRGIAGEILASLQRRGSDRRYNKWSISGVLLAVAIPAGLAGTIWVLVRSVFSG